MKENMVRLNFDFPRNQYPYLKLILAKKHLSLKDFATDIILKALEDAENEILYNEANERIETATESDMISWDEAKREAGWNE